MQPPSTASSSSSNGNGDIPNIQLPTHVYQIRVDERATSALPRLLCDCHINIADGQALHEAAKPSRLGGLNLEACLECALFVARRGDLLTRDELCLAYHGSCRCSHCALRNHDCSEIHCATLREAVNRLFELCQRYFYADEARTLQLAKSLFDQQRAVLSCYNESNDRQIVSS